MKVELDIDIESIANIISEAVVFEINKNKKSNQEKDDVIFDVKSLAIFLKVTPQWIYQRVRYNEIPFYKIGKFTRFRKTDIEAWLNDHKIMSTKPFNAIKRRT